MSNYDAIVVGAGMGGLSAAVALAARGLRVHVVEAGPQIGGKAGESSFDGVSFDTGPSVLTLPDVLDRVLRSAGTSLADEVDLLQPDPATRYLYPLDPTDPRNAHGHDVLDVWRDMEKTVASADDAWGGDAADDLRYFLDYARTIWEAAAPHFIFGPAPELPRLMRILPTAIRLLPRIDPLRTMHSAATSRVRDESVRWLFERFATYNGSDPRRAPATLHCIAHVELALGIYGVRGGMHQLPKALARVLQRHGGTVQLHAPVTRVRTEGGRVAGVDLADGATLYAPCVVVNADAAHLRADLLGDAERPRLPAPGPPSMSGWTAVLRARRRDASDRLAHTVLFPQAYMREFEDIFDHDRPPTEPTVYLCAQEKAHARAGWADHEPLFVMANAPPEPDGLPSAPEAWPALREIVLGRLRAANLIDPDDAVVWERTPTALATRFPGTRGAIYGAASNDRWAAFRRPPNRLKIPGLYLASGSAHPGGGVPLCVQSGAEAARLALEDLGV